MTTQLPSMSPSPSLALFPLLLFFTHLLHFVHTDSTGNIAFYPTSTCKTPLSINNFTLGTDVCGNPFTIDDPLNTALESYIINERPTCSDGHIPTFYTYQDEACYQGEAERPEIGLESDTSCVNSSPVMAVAFICYGFGNLDGNEWENTGGDDGCGVDGGNEEGNDVGGNYNGCTFNVGTAVYGNGATSAGCNGVYDGGCVATSSSGTVTLITASASTTHSSPATTQVLIVSSPQLPVPMSSETMSSSTIAGNPSIIATITSSGTASPQHTTPTTSAATLPTSASAKSNGSKSSPGVKVFHCALIPKLAAALMLMNF